LWGEARSAEQICTAAGRSWNGAVCVDGGGGTDVSDISISYDGNSVSL